MSVVNDFIDSRVGAVFETQRAVCEDTLHDLGGLLIKEALVRISESDNESSLLDMIFAIFFSGTPHDGMDIETLVPIVKDQPKRILFESLNAMHSQIL